MVVNAAGTATLPPKGHAPTAEKGSLLDRVEVLIAVESLGQRTSYLERALDPGLSLEACRRADNGAQ